MKYIDHEYSNTWMDETYGRYYQYYPEKLFEMDSPLSEWNCSDEVTRSLGYERNLGRIEDIWSGHY